MTASLIQVLIVRKDGCGIDESTKDFKLKIGNQDILSKGCSLDLELKPFFDYLDKLPAKILSRAERLGHSPNMNACAIAWVTERIIPLPNIN